MDPVLFNILDKIFWSVFILFIWFNTDAFTQYLSFLSFLKIKEFKDHKLQNPEIKYTEFLLIKYPNYFTKLISCAPCILFWIVLFLSHIYHFSHFAIVYIISYVIYRLLDKYI